MEYDLDSPSGPLHYTCQGRESNPPALSTLPESLAGTQEDPRILGRRLVLGRWRPVEELQRGNNDVNISIVRRMMVYRHSLYSLHVGANLISNYSNLSRSLFQSDTRLRSRARAWIRRELEAIREVGETRALRKVNSLETLAGYIVRLLSSIDLQESGGLVEGRLRGLFGLDKTRLFLHELKSWLRSPYSAIDAWDRHVQYEMDLDVLAADYLEPPRDLN